MKIDWKIHNNIVVLLLEEEVLSHPGRIQEFESALIHAFSGDNHVLVDLSKVAFMNSYAIRVLLAGLEKSRKTGKKFALCGIRTEVMLTMRVLQISELIPNYTDSYEALNHF